MDILTALNDANPDRGTKRCKVQAFLDSITDDIDGKAALAAAVADAAEFPAQRLTVTFSALKHPISDVTINAHRAKRCRCFR